MENSENKQQNIFQKESEIVGAHAKEIIERRIIDSRDVNKWIDALCMDEEICTKILGENVYSIKKDTLKTTKQNLDITDDKAILLLPEFQEFLQKYTLDKQRKEQSLLLQEEINKKKGFLKNMDLPEVIREEKVYIESIKTNIREILSEKDEKTIGIGRTFSEIAKKYIPDEESRKQKLNIIYDFIFNYGESSSIKKKRKTNESSLGFYNRIGIDYMINEVRRIIQESEKKVQSKIKKRKEKQGEKIDTISENKKIDTDHTKEALQLFCDGIDDNLSVKSKFYLPADQKQIERIQKYFKKNLNESIISPDMEFMVKDSGTQKNVLEKTENKIKTHISDYSEMVGRKFKFEKKFLDNEWNPREYLFDRLIEYIGKDILKYEIQEAINNTDKYKGTTFDIYKTDCLDDSFAGADYAILYKFKNETSKRLALIDLFVSDKELKTDSNVEEEIGSYAAKIKKAKELKIPYSLYCWLFSNIDQKSYKMKGLTRYVEKQAPSVVYKLLKEMIEKGNIDVGKALREEDIKNNICLVMNKRPQTINKNTLQEIDKNAA